MNAGQVIEQDIPVHFSLRIAKVNKETREVEGVCTQEVTDVHGEVVDHESMKAALLDWPGNIREMHQPIAVGKAVRVESDDAAKATILRARISKGAPDTWAKVEDGTLSMYSIGGTGKKVTKKNADGSTENRIFLSKLHEISLVDNGACPTAKFEVVKMVDGQSVECQPAELPDPQIPETETVVDVLNVGGMRQVLARLLPVLTTQKVATALSAHAVADVAVTKLEAAVSIDPAAVQKRAYPTPYNIEQTLGAIALLERICAEEWWKARDAESAEEDATTDKLQLQVLRNAIELVIQYLLSEFNAQFADLDAEAAGVDIMNAAIARRVDVVEKAAFAMPMVFSKLDGTGQLWLAKAGARHSKSDTQMVQAMHDTAVSLGAVDCAACVKAATEKAAAPNADGTPPVPAQEPIARAADAPVAPAAAPVQEPATPAPAAASDTTVQNVAGITTDDVQQIVTKAVREALQTHKAASDATIAELQAQITKLSNEPAPGGPKARATGTEAIAVHKSIGNAGAANLEDVDPASLNAFAAQLAKDATTQEERDRIAFNLLKFQHSTGAGAVVLKQSTSRRTDQS